MINKTRQPADPDRSTNKLVCPMLLSADLWIRTDHNHKHMQAQTYKSQFIAQIFRKQL